MHARRSIVPFPVSTIDITLLSDLYAVRLCALWTQSILCFTHVVCDVLHGFRVLRSSPWSSLPHAQHRTALHRRGIDHPSCHALPLHFISYREPDAVPQTHRPSVMPAPTPTPTFLPCTSIALPHHREPDAVPQTHRPSVMPAPTPTPTFQPCEPDSAPSDVFDSGLRPHLVSHLRPMRLFTTAPHGLCAPPAAPLRLSFASIYARTTHHHPPLPSSRGGGG